MQTAPAHQSDKAKSARSFADVGSVVMALEPSYQVFCLRPRVLDAAARRFMSLFPGTVLYAVKCNPHPMVLDVLYQAGIRHFDTASLPEIAQVHDGVRQETLPMRRHRSRFPSFPGISGHDLYGSLLTTLGIRYRLVARDRPGPRILPARPRLFHAPGQGPGGDQECLHGLRHPPLRGRPRERTRQSAGGNRRRERGDNRAPAHPAGRGGALPPGRQIRRRGGPGGRVVARGQGARLRHRIGVPRRLSVPRSFGLRQSAGALRRGDRPCRG